jgi:hypothetical protein
MKPSQKQLIAKIKSACAVGLKTSTLGKRSRVIFGKDAKGNYVKAGGAKYRITNDLLNAVTRQHLDLLKKKGANRLGHPHHLSAGQYNKPNWKNCPNNRACPFIAAALKS